MKSQTNFCYISKLEKCHLDIVKYLIVECKVYSYINSNNGCTPLHSASWNGHLDIVKYLVGECKADPNIKNDDGETPLHYASEKGDNNGETQSCYIWNNLEIWNSFAFFLFICLSSPIISIGLNRDLFCWEFGSKKYILSLVKVWWKSEGLVKRR